MKKIKSFIKSNWTDPVWSKVFAAGIISLISTFAFLLWALIKKVPFVELWNKTIAYLNNNSFQVSYLTLAIVLVCFLIILIPMIGLKIISFQLKTQKTSNKLKTQEFNIDTLLNGKWECKYTNSTGGGSEITEIKEGNKYFLNNKLYFVLTDIVVEFNNKSISWTKTSYPHATKHSRENLVIMNDHELKGKDDIGYELTYSKIS